jgi:hypothetical protein
MNGINSYWIITAASVVVVISYFFNLLSRRTNFPSVLMLLILGMLIRGGLSFAGVSPLNLDTVLEILGIIGLIMIVLEAALDLKFTSDKRSVILKAFFLALCSLTGSVLLITLLMHMVLGTDSLVSMIYAIPLSVVSSAIVIPSVVNFREDQRELLVYEATFSDILGILFFYFTIESTHIANTGRLVLSILGNLTVTVAASAVLSLLIILVFQRIRTQVKLFLLLAVLIILYSAGKLLHLSSLILILIFGMTISLFNVFRPGLITVSLIITGILLCIRYVSLKLILRRGFREMVFLIPRGLITILLYYSIPPEYQSQAFDPGLLFLTILFTSILMTISLVHHKWQQRLETIRRDHVYEAYGRFIPENWIPESSLSETGGIPGKGEGNTDRYFTYDAEIREIPFSEDLPDGKITLFGSLNGP